MKAVEKKFSPEFVNRVQHQVVFRALTEESIDAIFEIELRKIRARILKKLEHSNFTISVSVRAKKHLISQGFSPKYGARSLKRIMERDMVFPVANLWMSGQIELLHQVSPSWPTKHLRARARGQPAIGLRTHLRNITGSEKGFPQGIPALSLENQLYVSKRA